MKGYNFAYLDEQTKRMIRRALLKAVAIPGHQVPFGSREMPLPYGWGTGGIQVTASVLGADDVLKVIDQGADDTTNAVSIRRFFARTAGVRTTTHTAEATVIQTRHRIPEKPLRDDQIIVYQVPQPEPLFRLEPVARRDAAHARAGRLRADACEAVRGHRALRPDLDQLRLSGDGEPSLPDVAEPDPGVRQSEDAHDAGVAVVRRRAREAHLRDPALDATCARWISTTIRSGRSTRRIRAGCAAPTDAYLDEVVIDDRGGRLFVCSDTDHCAERRAAGHVGTEGMKEAAE